MLCCIREAASSIDHTLNNVGGNGERWQCDGVDAAAAAATAANKERQHLRTESSLVQVVLERRV